MVGKESEEQNLFVGRPNKDWKPELAQEIIQSKLSNNQNRIKSSEWMNWIKKELAGRCQNRKWGQETTEYVESEARKEEVNIHQQYGMFCVCGYDCVCDRHFWSMMIKKGLLE